MKKSCCYAKYGLLKVCSSGTIKGIFEDKYGKRGSCKIKNMPSLSIPLSWSCGPTNTVSYAITLIDYDAISVIGFPWIHWLVANISSNITSLPENVSRHCSNMIEGLTSFAQDYIVKLKDLDSFRVTNRYAIGYGGFAPPNEPHVYTTMVYALNCYLSLNSGFTYNELLKSMDGHIVAKGIFKGIYKN